MNTNNTPSVALNGQQHHDVVLPPVPQDVEYFILDKEHQKHADLVEALVERSVQHLVIPMIWSVIVVRVHQDVFHMVYGEGQNYAYVQLPFTDLQDYLDRVTVKAKTPRLLLLELLDERTLQAHPKVVKRGLKHTDAVKHLNWHWPNWRPE